MNGAIVLGGIEENFLLLVSGWAVVVDTSVDTSVAILIQLVVVNWLIGDLLICYCYGGY